MRLPVFVLALFAIVSLNPSMTMAEDVSEQTWSLNGLAGTYTISKNGTSPGPAVLILPGSGPTDRDGNSTAGIRAGTYRLLAHALAANGIRALRYDKRGIGGSAAGATREEDLRFDTFVEDAASAMRDLQARPNVSGVILVGHSEGGLIALRVAGRVPVKGLALVASPGQPFGDSLREQLLAAPLPKGEREEAIRILNRLIAGERIADVPPSLAPLFRPSVQPYLASLFSLDPTAEFRKLALPVLIVHAGRDLQIGEAHLKALIGARPDAKVVRLPKANHVLKEVGESREANLTAYTNPDLPLDPALVPALVDFVRTVAR